MQSTYFWLVKLIKKKNHLSQKPPNPKVEVKSKPNFHANLYTSEYNPVRHHKLYEHIAYTALSRQQHLQAFLQSIRVMFLFYRHIVFPHLVVSSSTLAMSSMKQVSSKLNSMTKLHQVPSIKLDLFSLRLKYSVSSPLLGITYSFLGPKASTWETRACIQSLSTSSAHHHHFWTPADLGAC